MDINKQPTKIVKNQKYSLYEAHFNQTEYQVLFLELEAMRKVYQKDDTSLLDTFKKLKQNFEVYGMIHASYREEKKKEEIRNILPYLTAFLSEESLRTSMQTPAFYGKAMQKIHFTVPERILVVSKNLETLHCARRSYMGTCYLHSSQNTFDVRTDMEISSLTDLPKQLILTKTF